MKKILHSDTARLLILTYLHFVVDFAGGIMIPLPEPTMTAHLGVRLPVIAAIIGGSAIVANAIQPLSSWVLPQRGLPILLLVAPLLASLSALVGLSTSVPIVTTMLMVGALGVGLAHPEATLAAHSMSGKRTGFGVSFFMAGGYFGFSLGSYASGAWVDYNSQGLHNFWMLAAPAVVAAFLIWLSGLHKLEGHVRKEEPGEGSGLSVWVVLALCICIAVNMCILVRILPIYFVRSFPGQDPQKWGGAVVFATGAFGAIGAFTWGWLSDRVGRGRILLLTQVMTIPFLYMLLKVDNPRMGPVWAAGVGLTMGAVFPLAVVLARQAGGMTQRMRMGLAIGGAWGLGEVMFILGGKYIGQFADTDPAPAATALRACWVLLAMTAILSAIIAVQEHRSRKSELGI